MTMDAIWWQLPSPERYIELVEQDLRDGRSVLLALPEHGPTGLRSAIARMVRQNELWGWCEVNLSDFPSHDNIGIPESPVQMLHRRFLSTHKPGAIQNVASLIGSEGFLGMVIWIEGMTLEIWPQWEAFIQEYEHVSRNQSLFDRTLFCIPLVGISREVLPTEKVALNVRLWQGFVDRFDISLYFIHLLKGRDLHPLHRRVMVGVGAELAGTDPELARILAQQDLGILLEPCELLTKVSKLRNWTVEPRPRTCWETGVSDEFEGRIIQHSAWVAADGNNVEISRRIWRGQIGVLFPFVEEQRVRFLDELRSSLQLPYTTAFGTITDLHELEIAHIYKQVCSMGVSRNTKETLRLLVNMRHALAHLEPIVAEDLMADPILQCFSATSSS